VHPPRLLNAPPYRVNLNLEYAELAALDEP
jgi:hypothetical protein